MCSFIKQDFEIDHCNSFTVRLNSHVADGDHTLWLSRSSNFVM